MWFYSRRSGVGVSGCGCLTLIFIVVCAGAALLLVATGHSLSDPNDSQGISIPSSVGVIAAIALAVLIVAGWIWAGRHRKHEEERNRRQYGEDGRGPRQG